MTGSAVARVAVALAFLVAAAAAQERSPPKAALDAEVEAIHALGPGKSGKDAIDRFFVRHSGDPRVLADLPALESDLRRCLFRMSGPQPTTLQLLGRGAVKYDANTSRAEFKVAATTDDAGWRDAGEDVRIFDALFDGEATVELSPATAWDTTVLLGFDFDTRGAYAFVPTVIRFEADDPEVHKCPVLLRLDPGAAEPVKLGSGTLIFRDDQKRTVKYGFGKGKVSVAVTGRVAESWETHVFEDAKYQRGFVAVRGPAKFDTGGLTISGRLDPAYARRQIAEADSRRFREWRAAKWKRDVALPAWVLKIESSGGAWAETQPADCPPELRVELVALTHAAFDASDVVCVILPRADVPGAAGAWQEALLAFAQGRHADAEAAARKAMTADPKFPGAFVVAGRALLARGADAAAVALFEEARRLDPAFTPASDGLALAAFRAGDLDRAQSILSEEAAAGVSSALAAELRQILFRARRGPDWKKRYESFSPNYVVSGDASIAVCTEIARTLEEAADIYGKQFRRRPRTSRGRVRVFSGFDSYSDYAEEVGAEASNTLGMYLPQLRELCVHLHEDRTELSNTIRHEGFHQYLHDFLDDVPTWFNEGYAEYFGFSRRKQGKALVGQVGEEQAFLARKLLASFTPFAQLFVMNSEEFMAKASIHYVEAWAIIHALREPRDDRLKGVLDRYFDALLAGRGRREAYDQVLAPLLPVLGAEVIRHVQELPAK